MFDAPPNLPVEPSAAPPSSGPGPFVAPPRSPMASKSKKEPEDILEEVEHDMEPPKTAPRIDDIERAPRSAGMQKKLIIILSVIVVALLITAGGILFYRRYVATPSAPPAESVPSTDSAGAVSGAEVPAEVVEPDFGNSEPAVPPTPPPDVPAPTLVEPSADTDGDGLSDDEEASLGTDLQSADTDGDGLDDGYEQRTSQTNPLIADTDGDILTDGDEVNVWQTDPTKTDTDGDGFTDGQEVQNGYNPLGDGKLRP